MTLQNPYHLKKLLNKFASFGLPVDGIALLRQIDGRNVLAIGDRSIDVNSCNIGYIRTSGIKRYTQGQRITGCDFVNNVAEDLFLVLILSEDKNLDAYVKAARQVIDSDNDLQITQIDVNKDNIQRVEAIPPSLNKLVRISFTWVYQEVGDCPEGVCEWVEDLNCGIEPCEGRSFCERVQDCLPPPLVFGECFTGEGTEESPIEISEECLGGVTDCTLEVGGCCDYSVTNVAQLNRCVTFEISPEIMFSSNSPYFGFSDFSLREPGTPFANIFSITNFTIGTFPTYTQLLDAIEASFNSDGGRFSYVRNETGFTVCYLGSDATVLEIRLTGNHNQGDAPFVVLPPTTITDTVLVTNQVLQQEFLLDNTLQFEVLINGTWVDETSNVVDGTWQSLNDCRTITDWRIIDSEENVIDTGQVTASNCGTTETKTVCEWLQEHQTEIEELQNNPTGLTCETLTECEAFQEVAELAGSAVQPDDLAAVAFSGDYTDLSNRPSIPAAQIQSDWAQSDNLAVDFIKNKPTAVSAFSNDAGYQTAGNVQSILTNQRVVRTLGIDVAATELTGSVTNGILGSILIPANTITGAAIIEVEAWLQKASASAAPAHRIWINTANNLSGAVQIALSTGGTATLSSKMERSLVCSASGLTVLSSIQNASVDDTVINAAPTVVVRDWTVNQWILHTANNATGEKTRNVILWANISI